MRPLRITAVAGALFTAALLVAVVSHWAPLARLDRSWEVRAHAAVLHDSGLLTAARVVTWWGHPLVVDVLAFLVTVALLLRGHALLAAYVALTRVGAAVLSTTVKDVVQRPRPAFDDAVAHAAGWAFPSGHALGAASLYLSLAVVATVLWGGRRAGWTAGAAAAVAAAVGATRVLLGVHWPSDVVGGLALGAMWSAAAALALGRARMARTDATFTSTPMG